MGDSNSEGSMSSKEGTPAEVLERLAHDSLNPVPSFSHVEGVYQNVNSFHVIVHFIFFETLHCFNNI